MQLSQQEETAVIHLWDQYEKTLSMILDRLVVEYSKQIVRQDSEWETLRQSIEFTAKRQTLIDLKNILKTSYGQASGQ